VIVKAALFALLVLVSCQTPGRDMDVATSPLAYETSEDSPFTEPSFYARWVNRPFVLFVGSDNLELYNAIENAAMEINQAVGFPLVLFEGIRQIEDGEEEYRGRNGINAVVEVSDEVYTRVAEKNPASLAITKLITSRKQLYEADIMIRRSTINSQFLRATILHELGHAVGLGHTQDKRSFMYPQMRDPKRSQLGPDDVRVLSQHYAH
jgi:hypothetical protein